MFVVIAPDEFNMICHVALSRTIQSIKANRKDSLSKKNWLENLSTHIIGCVGELAVAKALGRSWSGSVDTFKGESDISGDIEVRHRSNPEFQLIVRNDDDDDRTYVLSRGMPPGVIEVVGWINGSDAKQVEYVKDPGGYGRPAYFVPDYMLNSMEELP